MIQHDHSDFQLLWGVTQPEKGLRGSLKLWLLAWLSIHFVSTVPKTAPTNVSGRSGRRHELVIAWEVRSTMLIAKHWCTMQVELFAACLMPTLTLARVHLRCRATFLQVWVMLSRCMSSQNRVWKAKTCLLPVPHSLVSDPFCFQNEPPVS